MSEKTTASTDKKTEVKSENSVSPPQKSDSSQFFGSPVDRILFLQRTIGNQAVGGLISSGALQTKFKIGQPRDPYEPKTDNIEKHIVSELDKPVSQLSEHDKSVQCKTPEEEDEKKLVGQAKFIERPSGINQVNSETSQNNTGMSDQFKSGLENLSGMDLGSVRIHHNSSRPAQLNAVAYTQGQDIYIANSQEKHLPHEGWHVVQQMQGRVNPTRQINSESINDNPSLEQEADVMGSKALQMMHGSIQHHVSHNKGSNLIQSKTIQCLIPALSLAGIGAALASATVTDAATMAGLLLAVGAGASSVGAAIMPGNTGVQSVSLENGWMSNRDKNSLEMIIRYRIVNAYIDRFAREHPTLFITEEEERQQQSIMPPAGSRSSSSTPTSAPLTEAASNRLDETILESVKTSVSRDIENILNRNQRTALNKEYIWSDSGDHTADVIGTVGAIVFSTVRGTYINEILQLNHYARQVPNLALPLNCETMNVRQFRGGTMRRSPIMETGLNDTLGINLSGSGPDIDPAGNEGHGIHTYKTDWNWDDNTTQGDFGIYIDNCGVPIFLPPVWTGTPED